MEQKKRTRNTLPIYAGKNWLKKWQICPQTLKKEQETPSNRYRIKEQETPSHGYRIKEQETPSNQCRIKEKETPPHGYRIKERETPSHWYRIKEQETPSHGHRIKQQETLSQSMQVKKWPEMWQTWTQKWLTCSSLYRSMSCWQSCHSTSMTDISFRKLTNLFIRVGYVSSVYDSLSSAPFLLSASPLQ